MCEQILAFKENNFDKIKEMHINTFMPYDVKMLIKEIGKIELNFFLKNTANKYLQQAINIFVSSREPYSVKIFTTNKNLLTYYDIDGNLIECPHDYMRRSVNNIINLDITQST